MSLIVLPLLFESMLELLIDFCMDCLVLLQQFYLFSDRLSVILVVFVQLIEIGFYLLLKPLHYSLWLDSRGCVGALLVVLAEFELFDDISYLFDVVVYNQIVSYISCGGERHS